MRKDFTKLLTERQRVNSTQKFRHVRRKKQVYGFDDEFSASKESMTWIHRVFGFSKEFGEFLSPLEGWVKSCEGKVWDQCYSELSKSFDRRKVTSDHIWNHLDDFIARVVRRTEDGLQYLNKSGWNGGWRDLETFSYNRENFFYVCPDSGLVKRFDNSKARQDRVAVNKGRRRQGGTYKSKKSLKLPDRLVKLIDGKYYCFDRVEFPADEVRVEKRYIWQGENVPMKIQSVTSYVIAKVFDELYERWVSKSPTNFGIRNVQRYHCNKRLASPHDLKKAKIPL